MIYLAAISYCLAGRLLACLLRRPARQASDYGNALAGTGLRICLILVESSFSIDTVGTAGNAALFQAYSRLRSPIRSYPCASLSRRNC